MVLLCKEDRSGPSQEQCLCVIVANYSVSQHQLATAVKPSENNLSQKQCLSRVVQEATTEHVIRKIRFDKSDL